MRRHLRVHRSARGSVTVFVLGLTVAAVGFGGLAVDAWRLLAVRRGLSAVADAVATAGANGLDPSSLRAGGARLDPAIARRLALEEFAHQRAMVRDPSVSVAADTNHVGVVLRERVSLSLLGILAGRDDVTVEVHAQAAPLRVP